MLRLRFVCIPLLAVLPFASGAASAQDLNDELGAQIRAHKIPGMVAAVFRASSVVATGAVGVRQTGKVTAITIGDHFHIGSNAKAMLATVIGMLVEEGKLSWQSKPIEVLHLSDIPADEGYRNVTLLQLLNHHAGVPAFEDDKSPEWRTWIRKGPANAKPSERVLQFAKWVLTQPPAVRPGSKFLYSNAGYTIAAAMAEQVTGATWKDLLRNRLFTPLKMDADFIWPAALGTDQPQGHYETASGLKLQDRNEVFPPFVEPAGNVELSILDYIKFLQLHLRGLAGSDGLVKAGTVRLMHTPTDRMGMGWKISDFDGVPASFHTGSADTFFAIATLLPSLDLGVVVLVNSGGDRAQAAALAATKNLLARYREPK